MNWGWHELQEACCCISCALRGLAVCEVAKRATKFHQMLSLAWACEPKDLIDLVIIAMHSHCVNALLPSFAIGFILYTPKPSQPLTDEQPPRALVGVEFQIDSI